MKPIEFKHQNVIFAKDQPKIRNVQNFTVFNLPINKFKL